MLPMAADPASSLPLEQLPLGSAAAILAAANLLLIPLERGQPIDTGMLRIAMETAFGTSDTSGSWC